MKFNVEINVDWINEDYSVDEAISDQIKNKLADKIMAKIDVQIADKIASVVNEHLDKKIMDTYDDFLSREIILYDKWGDPSGKKQSVKDLLKEKLDKFLSDQIDSNRRVVSGYGTTRYDDILNRQAKAQIDDFVKAVSHEIIKGIKEDINKEAVRKISQSILSDYDLKTLIK